MTLLLAMVASVTQPDAKFPERTPQLIEACLLQAIESNHVEDTNQSHKYICSGSAAERLWTFLEEAKIESYEQDAGSDGHWLSRDFPLGGCFKRLRMADGTRATTGLSCTIWVPRRGGR